MAQRIEQAAVIGAGTMGRQIAAVIANADTQVLLLDVVPEENEGTNDRNRLARRAIGKLKEGKTLFAAEKARHIRPGNMEDDLEKLQEADWIIECVPEDEKIKQETFGKIAAHTHDGALVSSNTSTIPLARLKEGLDGGMRRRLCITHFFNPPVKMPLLELVTDDENAQDAVRRFADFADRALGRHVIMAKDTPGFIANRIGMFWLLCAMEEAKRESLSIERADAIMNGAFGFPRTGVFGLADMIGLELIPDIAQSMRALLPQEDAFCGLEEGLALVRERTESQGEGGSGFYRKTEGGRQALDLQSGKYREAREENVEAGHWHEFLEEDAPENRFARRALVRTLGYAAQVAPDVADSILDVDAAMRDGYGWKQGPFAMIDRLGAAWLAERMERLDMHSPVLLKQARAQGFYPHRLGMGKQFLAFSGRYDIETPEPDKWTLALKTTGSKPLQEGETSRLWDVGEGVACLEFTAKMGTIEERTLDALVRAVEKAEAEFSGLIVGHDGKHFSAGFDLRVVAECAESGQWERLDEILRQGQETMLRVKTARVPVIPALCGYVLGGACELTLHCVAAQAHALTRIGLVETDIGVIPAWGGTKEHLLRIAETSDTIDSGPDGSEKNPEQVIEEGVRVFRRIADARKSANAEEARRMNLLNEMSQITANRNRLLPDARHLCLEIAAHYEPREEVVIEAPVEALHRRFVREAEKMQEEEPNMSPHRRNVLRKLAETLSGHAALQRTQTSGFEPDRAGWEKLSERQVLDSTRAAFLELAQDEEALEKIRQVLKRR